MAKQMPGYNLEREEEIRSFWKKNRIAEKVREKSLENPKTFYFADGPPYATGHIHMGTALNKIVKDTALRSKRMQGFAVLDVPGYDTHGLPIEHKIEKMLDIKSKQEIFEYGVDKFVSECKKFATKYIDTMNNEFDELGAWFDWKTPYLTLSNEYIEAIWWTFKKAEEKGLLYLDSYSVHVCPRCETAVAYNEIEYVKQRDKSVFVKFPVRNQKNLFLVIWTTTPWTLPGNTGVMVHPDFEYDYVKAGSETWIIASKRKDFLQKISGKFLETIKTVKGTELEGMLYENPLKKHLSLPKLENAYRVVLSYRFVNLEEGTGLVHTAPGHGKEDYEIGKKKGLPVICPVKLSGELKKEAGKYAGKKARIVDSEIIEDLEKDGFLVAVSSITHDYPVCWRCKTPLLMLASPQWFFDIKSLQKKLITENKKVKWVPEWMKARMHNWLESLGDWPVSRERFWGTPLPIWVCSKCNEKQVFGSIKELSEKTVLPEKLDLHKPFIDKIVFPCSKCNGKMKRVSFVLDVWFDSGVSTWGGIGFPSKKDLFERFWPADLEIEGTDQVRGWWNSQMITSMICFDRLPFKAVATHGLVLDVSRIKMSKSIGNVVKPGDAIKRFNRDYLRYYLVKQSKGQDIAFDWNDFRDVKRFFSILENTLNFCSLYLELDFEAVPDKKSLKVEDKWLLAKTEGLKRECIKAFNEYEFFIVPTAIEDFVLNDLSRTYIKIVRNREDKKIVSSVLSYVLFSVLRLLAPVSPHFTEYAYRFFKKEKMSESIHFNSLPEPKPEFEDKELTKKMKDVLMIVQEGLALRAKERLRLRWPLNALYIEARENYKAFFRVIAVLANVKNVFSGKPKTKGYVSSKTLLGTIHLKINVEKQLKDEWELKELLRLIQGERKNKKLVPGERVVLKLFSSDKKFLEKHKKTLEEKTFTKIKFDSSLNKNARKLVLRSFAVSITST